MNVEELADLLTRPPEPSRIEGLDGVAAEWHFWACVTFRVHMTTRGAIAPAFERTMREDSFDIDVPGVPGWRRTISNIVFDDDDRVCDYAVNGVKLSDRIMLVSDAMHGISGAARITGDIDVCALDDLFVMEGPTLTKRSVNARTSVTAPAAPLRAGLGIAVVKDNRIAAAAAVVHLIGRDPASLFDSPAEVSPAQLRAISQITITAPHCPPIHLRPLTTP